MKVINVVANLFLMVLVVLNAVVSEIRPSNSSYSFRLNLLDCNNVEPLRGCRHEIGHKMDDDMNMPSLSFDFAIQTQILVEKMWITLEPDEFAVFVSVYPDKDPRELYAALYSYVDGDVSRLPANLQTFYSFDRSYLDLYECLSKDGLNICGMSVSNLRG